MPEIFAPSVEPILGAGDRSRASVDRIDYGDGYSQRASKSANPVRRTLNLEWRGVQDSVADAIAAFLIARRGAQAFSWQPPRGAASLWTCEEWDVRTHGPATQTVTAVFVEEFDLA